MGVAAMPRGAGEQARGGLDGKSPESGLKPQKETKRALEDWREEANAKRAAEAAAKHAELVQSRA